jgi:hypothetical protein
MDRDEKRIDELLDAGLAGYADVEPRAGLEGRILARLSNAAAEPEQKAWPRWWPAWGLALAIAIALFVVVSMPKRSKPIEAIKETPKAAPQVAPTVVPRQLATNVAPQILHDPRKHVALIQASQAPQVASVKEAVFPSASALTEQEKLIFAYLRRTPADEVVAQAKPDEVPDVFQQQNRLIPTGPANLNLGK